MTPNSRPVLSSRLALCVLMGALVTLPSCSTLKSLGKKDTVVARAEKSETDYYQEAQEAITKKRFNQASVALTNLRTFYPTGRYAEQALSCPRFPAIAKRFSTCHWELIKNMSAKWKKGLCELPSFCICCIFTV